MNLLPIYIKIHVPQSTKKGPFYPQLQFVFPFLVLLPRSAPDAAAPGGAPGAPGAPGADGAPGGAPPGPPNTSSNRRLQQTQAQVEEVSQENTEILHQNVMLNAMWNDWMCGLDLNTSWFVVPFLSVNIWSASFVTCKWIRTFCFRSSNLIFHLLRPSSPSLLNAVSSCGLGGGYHAGECRQGFGKGPEAFRAGWQSGCSPSRSLPVWKLRC